MADTAPLTLENNTPEKIALELMQMVAHIEKKALHSGPAAGWTAADRGWLLQCYAECIQAVRSPEAVEAPAPVRSAPEAVKAPVKEPAPPRSAPEPTKAAGRVAKR